MKYFIRFFIYFLFIASPKFILAQITKDTANFYYKLEIKANKYRLTSWVYDVVFEEFSPNDSIVPIKLFKKKTVNPFLKFQGKKIRNINIEVLDPFGYSVNEFYGKAPDYLEKIGNKYHITTKEHIIRNLLLFKSNQPIDAIELSESERILRLSPFIFDARIYIQKSFSVNNDSIDILVITQDRWTATVTSDFNLASPDIVFNDKNILGFGHQFSQGIAWNATDKHITTSGKYSIYNIKKSFVGLTAFYATTKENKQIGAVIERLFFSPLTKWAGGLSVSKNNTIYQQTFNETIINKYPLTFNTLDIWGAKSFALNKKNMSITDKQSIKLITGARYFNKQIFERPSFVIDTERINREESMLLINIGITQRKYYRDRYLFRYGANEDIPEGNMLELVLGTMNKELSKLNYYTGIKFGTGKHIDNFGYISIGGGYGTFYNANNINSGVVNFDAFYFSDLINRNRWYFRQFIRFKLIEGIDRANYELLNINGSQMYGFSSNQLTGKSKMILNLEFVMYAPYKIIGFQFAPVLFYGFAGLGNNFGNTFSSNFYQAFALGILIRNEYLVSNTFEISLGIYPYMPGSSDFTIKGNPIGNYDVKARDYFINKAELVPYY
jgi:hypothetical protein